MWNVGECMVHSNIHSDDCGKLWFSLKWNVLEWNTLQWTVVKWFSLKWTVVEWNSLECCGVEQSEAYSGVLWSGTV
jgi:hypothetical protein